MECYLQSSLHSCITKTKNTFLMIILNTIIYNWDAIHKTILENKYYFF